MMLNPIIYFLILLALLCFIFLYPFSYYRFIFFEDNLVSYIIFFSVIAIILGMLSVLLAFSRISHKKYINSSNIVFYYNKKILQIFNIIYIFGIICTILKIFLALKHFGIPSDFTFLIKWRLAFLSGEFNFPIVFEVGSKFLIGLYPIALLFNYFKVFTKKIVIILFLFIVLNDIIIGGRGNISFLVIVSILFYLYFNLFLKRKVFSFKLIIYLFLLIMSVISLFLFIGYVRENSDLSKVIEQFLTYFIGTFYASYIDVSRYIYENLNNTFGFYILGGIVRNFHLFHIQTDLGYVPIYRNYDYGFNSFLFVSYIIRDLGVVGLFIFSFLIGSIIMFLYIKLRNKFNIYLFFIFIYLQLWLFFFFRDTATKWTSFWLLLLVLILIKIGRVKIEKNTKC